MKLILETPVKLRIQFASEDEMMKLGNTLEYLDKTVEEKIRRMKKNPFFIKQMGKEAFHFAIQDLQDQLMKSLLFTDDQGFYTLPGVLPRLQREYQVEFENQVYYPEFQLIPWNKMPEFDPLPFQDESVELFSQNPHSHVEIATGLGKSHIATMLCKLTGLPTIISTPSIGLAKSMYKELVERFGKRKVGMFGGGAKKEIGKDILVCVGKSLSMVKDEDIKKFAKYQVFISDESHTLPANQFNYFCHNVLGHIPYRWFLSATQERNDGKDLLLEGIIGKKVFEMTIQEGQEKGYLAKLKTLIFDVPSYSAYLNTNNVVKMNQSHFYGNNQIIDIIAQIVPDALAAGIPTLILVDQHDQELLIRNRIGLVYEYARGGSDTDRICKDFNAGKIMCVVGTSAVSTGTNFKPVRLTINWQGGKAETKFKQGVIGRSTRIDKETGKTDCKIIDFRVNNIPMLKRHANARISLYKQVGPVDIVEVRS